MLRNEGAWSSFLTGGLGESRIANDGLQSNSQQNTKWKTENIFNCCALNSVKLPTLQKENKKQNKKRGFAVTHPRAANQHVMTWHHNEHLHQIKVQPLREQIHHCRLCIILYRIITVAHNYLFCSTFIITKSRVIFALTEEKTKQTKNGHTFTTDHSFWRWQYSLEAEVT